MRKILTILIYIINIPIYWLSILVPQKKNLWVFGSWQGEKYTDNSKYLFEYVLKEKSDIEAIWLTSSKSVYVFMQSKKLPVYYSYSLQGYWLAMRANVHIYTNNSRDTNLYIWKKHIINLWHGIPLKKMGYDKGEIYRKKTISIKAKIIRVLFPFLVPDHDRSVFIASSKEEASHLASSFGININQIAVTGLPRNDVFIKDNNVEPPKIILDYANLTKIIYMPTHRVNGKISVFSFLEKDLLQINSYLKDISSVLYVKLHFHHQSEIENLKEIYSNIVFLKDEDIDFDIYTVLPFMDILITDYSSVYFDFLLSEKPIIFLPYDFDDYVEQEKGFYYDYDAFTPGPKATSWSDVLKYVDIYKKDSTIDLDKRKEIKKKIHDYKIESILENVYKMIKSRIK